MKHEADTGGSNSNINTKYLQQERFESMREMRGEEKRMPTNKKKAKKRASREP